MTLAWRLLRGYVGASSQRYSLLYNGTDVAFNYNIGLARSTDNGVSWTKYAGNPVLSQGGSGWDSVTVVDPSVFWDGAQWVMYYAGLDAVFEIGRATSPDLITWTKDAGNPVLTAAPTYTDVNFPTAYLDGSLTRLWYTGWLGSGVTVIAYAEVSGGVLTGVGTVIGAGSSGAFDDSGLATGPIVKVGSTWYVFYAGLHSTRYHTGYATATTPDTSGTYTKHGVLSAFSGDLVLSGVTYHSNQLRSIVTLSDGTYRGFGSAFHSGDGTEVSFTSTSADLVTWATPTGPILPLGAGGQWDSNSVENPVVVAA